MASRTAVLGNDIVPSQMIAALSVPGVYQVELNAPELAVVAENQWANCTHITISVSGDADG